MKLLLTTILLVCQAFLLIIPVINKSSGKGVDKTKYNLEDIIMIFLSIIGLWFSLYIFLAVQDEENEKARLDNKYKQDLAIKLEERDSIHQLKDSAQIQLFTQKLDSSYLKSIKTSNEALAKYNLVLIDSLNKVSNRIEIESFKQPQFCLRAVQDGKQPIFMDKEGNKDILVIQFRSINNTSYNVKLKISLFKITNVNGARIFEFVNGSTGIGKRNILVAGDIFSLTYELEPSWMNIEKSLLVITAMFDSQNRTGLKYEDAAYFNFKENKSGGKLDGVILDSLKKKFKEEVELK